MSKTNIKVLGSGCKSCHQLYDNAKQAAALSDADVEYITDLQKIMEYGVMSMPALYCEREGRIYGKGAETGGYCVPY